MTAFWQPGKSLSLTLFSCLVKNGEYIVKKHSEEKAFIYLNLSFLIIYFFRLCKIFYSQINFPFWDLFRKRYAGYQKTVFVLIHLMELLASLVISLSSIPNVQVFYSWDRGIVKGPTNIHRMIVLTILCCILWTIEVFLLSRIITWCITRCISIRSHDPSCTLNV